MPAPAMPSISKVIDLAILSSGSYGTGTLPPGWVQIPVPLPADSARTGFSAITYKNVATGEVVVAFTGTNDKKDIAGSDAQIATHQPIEQHEQAIQYADAAAKAAGVLPDQLLLTGHSLGGALAQLAADFYQAAGITYNAPGVQWAGNPDTAGSNTSVLNIRLSFDAVSLTTSPSSGAIGHTLVIPANSAEGLQFIGNLLLTGGVPIIGLAALTKMGASAHFMDTVLTKLGQQHNTDSIDGWQRNTRGEWTRPGLESDQNTGASAEQTARLEHTRALLVEVNAMAVAAPERIAAAQAYGQALTQIQAQTGAQSLDMKALPNGDFAILDDQGRALGTLSLDDQGSALLSVGDKLYSIAANGVNADGVVGPTVSDALPPTTSPDPTDPGTQYADAGADPQEHNYLNLIDLPAPELANHFAGGNAGGAYGAGTLGGFDVLRLNAGVSFLVNEDGDIAGEINRLPNGDLQIKNLYGEAVYVNQAGAVLSQQDYQQAQQDQQDALTQAQWSQAASAVGLMNSIIGLQNWDDMGDLQRLAAVTSIYNALDKMSGGNALPGDLGTAASVLGLLNALDQGNVGGMAYSGLSLVEHLTYDAATKMGVISDTLGGNFLPGLGFVLALDSGDPVSIASSGLSLMSSLGYIGPWGAAAAVVITLLGSMFADDDIPMKEGQAHAQWDAQGNTQVITDQDTEGGGATATGWMNSIVNGLQQQLSQTKDAAGNSYALIPNLLPAIGYQCDADGMNYGSAPGHMYLKWTDDNGQSQTRYYDGAGNRADGTGETLASDFMAHAQGAIAPVWQVQTVLAHWQQGQGIRLPDNQASLPQELADGIHQSLQALTLELPTTTATTDALIDIDGDGYLEKTQWVAANQQIVTIDANGDGQIGAGELISLGGSALNSLNWLDANNDKVLNASDPAFGALRLWVDINSDGSSSAETQTLNQAGITAIDFGSNPPAVIRADGSRTDLTAQTLTGDILGVRYTATVGGVLEAKERGETVLHAVNTRQFDGQADHMQGGDADTDGTAEGEAVLINAQDSRLSTTTARTLANRPVFVPIAATTQAQAQREVTQAMVTSAGSSLFGATIGAAPLTALALAAGAVQWPAVAAANSTGVPAEEGAASSATTTPVSQAAGVQHAPAAGTFATSAGSASSTPATPADPMRIELSALQIGRVITGGQPIADEGQAVSAFDASNQALAQAGWAQAATDSVANPSSPADSVQPPVSGLSATLLGSAGCDIQLTYPTVMGELIAGTEDIGLRIAAALLLANDSTLNAGDPSRPILSISAVGSPSHGQVALRINEAGATEVVFIPETNYHGPASFVYTVTDQYGLSTVATATLEIVSVNDAPTPVADVASGDEDATLMFTAASLLANDFDVDSAVDGDVLRITRVGLAEHGQVFLQADGNIRFVPDLNYNGPAQFSYWVADRSEAAMATASGGSIPGGVGLESPGTMHLTVLPVNDLPVVTGEAIASDEDIVLTINPALLLANDSDVDTATNGQVLTISAVSGAQHGAVVLLADGTVQFTPEQDYFGPATFVYTVDDGHGGQVQSTAVVNLASVNDVPVVNDELLMGKRNATYTLSQAALLANDTDLETPGSLIIVAVQGMSHGSAVLNANGSVTFTPEPGYAGRGRFEYVVQDADGGQAVAATEIDFATINVNPITIDDSFIGFEDIAFVIQANQLLANDTDPDASGLAAMRLDAVSNASNGTVILQGDGSVRFNPTANFYGTASFQYRSNDGEGGQTWATAYLNVQPVNDAPVITNIWYASGVDATVTVMPASLENGEITYFLQDDPYRQNGGVVAYDPDGDSSAITLSISGGPQHGHAWANVVVPNSAPAFMTHDAAPPYFAPQAGAWQYFSHQGDPYSGSDPFTITVTDGQGASTSALVYAAHQGSSAGGGGKCPIVMDLNGDGIELIRPEDSDIFADVNSDGWRERIGWAADEDGVLTFDANRDGRITENAEVSFVGYKEGARTDLDGLAAFDTDGDGKLNAGDAAWSQFGVLRDANGNGRQDEGELVSLDQLGVTAIGLLRQGSPRLDNGNVVFGTTDVTYADGRTGQAGDVMFAGENVPLPAAVQIALEAAAQAVLLPLSQPTEEEEVERLALLMTQYGALAEGPSEPLGFVDWTQASPTQSPAEAMASALVQTDHFGTFPTGNP